MNVRDITKDSYWFYSHKESNWIEFARLMMFEFDIGEAN